MEQTGAGAVFWNRLYGPAAVARDTALKAALKEQGLQAESFSAALLAEPWQVKTQAGDPYKVFTPLLESGARGHRRPCFAGGPFARAPSR